MLKLSGLLNEGTPGILFSGEAGTATSNVSETPFLEIYRAQGKVLTEIESFNSSVESQSPSGERLQALMRLDESSRPLQERLCQQYLSNPPSLNQHESSLWNRIFSLYWQLKRGYRALIRKHNATPGDRHTKSNVALITARALHYSAASFKWGYIRHVPVDAKIWQSLHSLYRTSEHGGFASHRLKLYENAEHTSCDEEYIRILLLELLSPLSLSPTQIEIADQWLRKRVKAVQLDDAYVPDKHLFCVDLARATGARKIEGSPKGTKLRFLAMGELLGRIDDVIAGADDLAFLSKLNVMEDWQQIMNFELASPIRTQWKSTAVMRPHPREAASEARKIFEHFRTQWSGAEHKRRYSREPVREIVEVACDMPNICKSLLTDETQGQSDRNQAVSAGKERIDLLENWTVQNRSEGGYGLCASADARPGICMNGLISLRGGNSGSEWEIGAIRRISQASPDEISIGVEIFSRTPTRVEVSGIDRAVLASAKKEPGANNAEAHTVEGILLSGLTDSVSPGSLILPFADYASRHFYLRYHNRNYRIRLANILERTETWIRVEFDDVMSEDGIV